MNIAQLNWLQVEEYLKKDDRVIVPLGCTEQHAYLSLATDTILSEKLSQEVGQELGVLVFPALAYGMTPSFTHYPGTISLRLDTYAALVVDLLDSLWQQGLRRILLLNGHGGNTPVQPALVQWRNHHPQARLLLHNWWASPKVWAMIQAIEGTAGHASWMENFPWTRLPGVELPSHSKAPLSPQVYHQMGAQQVRAYAGDGNFGGGYRSDDAQMLAIWQQAIAETVEVVTAGWKDQPTIGGTHTNPFPNK